MGRLVKFLLLTWLLFVSALASAQLQPPYKWSVELQPADVRPGEAAQIWFKLDLDEGWYAYRIGQEGGPTPITITIDESGPLEPIDEIIAPKFKEKFDKNFNVDVGYYGGSVIFAMPVRLKDGQSGEVTQKVSIRTQACTDEACDRPRTFNLDLKFAVDDGDLRTDRITASMALPPQPNGETEVAGTKSSTNPESGVSEREEKNSGGSADSTQNSLESAKGNLLAYFGLCFAAGLGALLTPCVFPMIPITVSFFSKRNPDDRKGNLRSAILYCVGIIATFTAIGILVTVLLGASGTLTLGNNPFVNGALFILFVAMALSLFGLFEIGIPAPILTKLNIKGQQGGSIAGPLFMGLAFSLTSFTCTVPIVGALLAGAAQGDLWYPALGMFGFSFAFSIPFFFLALFPGYIQKLPKSGGWMMTVKAFMGFLELAAAVKFLSNIDLYFQLGWITRPVFLAIWAAIFLFAGAHLLGWIRLPHDSPTKMGVGRWVFGLLSLSAATWFLSGINGYPLGKMASFLPPKVYPHKGQIAQSGNEHQSEGNWITNDYEKALAESKSTGKPLFIDFTGYT